MAELINRPPISESADSKQRCRSGENRYRYSPLRKIVLVGSVSSLSVGEWRAGFPDRSHEHGILALP